MVKKIESAVTKFKEANPNARPEEIEAYRQKRISYLPKRNPDEYTQELTPAEQGLKAFDEAMKDSGLVKVG